LIKNKGKLICTPNHLIPVVTVSYSYISTLCKMCNTCVLESCLCTLWSKKYAYINLLAAYINLLAYQQTTCFANYKTKCVSTKCSLHLIATSVHSRLHNWLYE